jgi:DNA-binding Xre family transcriptional regulator
MASTSAPAVANSRLTELCKKLYDNKVSIRELAEAAGVTYRAMYKRVIL